jgi:hypothetical protein
MKTRVPTVSGLPESWLSQAELSAMERQALEEEEDQRIRRMLEEYGVEDIDFDIWDNPEK